MIALVLLTPVAAAFDFSGVVTDLDERPLPEATVWLKQDDVVHRTTTDAKGKFLFPDAIVGPAAVLAYKDGYGMDGAPGPILGPYEVKLRLGPPGSLMLRITDDQHDTLTGARIRGLFVNDRFFVPAEGLADHGFPPARSNSEGILVFPNLPLGGHAQLVVAHHKYPDAFVSYLPIDGKKQNIVMYAGVTLRGRVKDPSGEGVAGAEVFLARTGTKGVRTFADTRTDRDGFFVLRARAGEYNLAARHPAHASPAPSAVTLAMGTEPAPADVKMLQPRTIEGSVIVGERDPVGGVVIAYWVKGVLYDSTLTAYDGAFRLVVPPGPGQLRVVAPAGYMTEELPFINVDFGERKTATLKPMRLKPLPVIEGTVKDAKGEPAKGALIATLNVDPPAWTMTDDEGRFKIRLSILPEDEKARFRAEHAERFLRDDFTVDIRKLRPVNAELEPFRPDIAHHPVEKGEEEGKNDLSVFVSKEAPEIETEAWHNSKPLTLAGLKGNVVALLFWGGFDKRPENFNTIEEFSAIHDVLRNVPGVVMVGIHDSASFPDEVTTYIKERRIEFPVGHDVNPFKTFERYRIQRIPQILLIDKQGFVRYFHTEGRLLELIKALRREG